MPIEWKKDFAIGVHEIDAQHQELFKRLDQLQSAIAAGRGATEIYATLEFLDEYTREHFKAEEALQRRFEYPHYELHAGEHRHFLDTLATLRHKIAHEGANDLNVKRASIALEQWLVTHICSTDRQLAGFINRHRNHEWEQWLKAQF
jgi:hemerythrin